MTSLRHNIRAQWLVAITAVVLFGIKLAAWLLTGSVAILTDALESTVNVVSGFLGLYSLYLSAKPRDADHPYGHGKVEFISAAVEGTLITVAGAVICYEAILNLWQPHQVHRLDWGLILISAAGLVNLLVGRYALRLGKRSRSLALQASGKHLLSDTLSTLGIIVGVLLMWWLQYAWLDSAIAMVFAAMIIYQGIGIIRTSVAGIMDETDMELLVDMVEWLNAHRSHNWIDLHNLRIIKYGSVLHMDAHLTVPWYFNVHEAHREIDQLHGLLREKFGESVELFVHTDGCLDFSCRICTLQDCSKRQHAFEKRIDWTVSNISTNSKHGSQPAD